MIFDNLGATLKAKAPATGSIEAKLLAWARRYQERVLFDPFEWCGTVPPADAPAREIVLQGFDAIPPLLALLDDNRLTDHPDDGARDKRILRVHDLASILLKVMTGTPDCGHGCDGGERDDAAQREWWERARSRKEVDVFSEAVFEREDGAIKSDRPGPARILAAKYPSRLPVLLKQFEKETNGERGPWAIAKALAHSALPKEARIQALADAATQGSLANRQCLIQILAKLDARKSADLLLPILRKLPADSDEPYCRCSEAAFRHIVMELEDDEVWRKFQRAAKRSSIGLRLEMMRCFRLGPKNRDRYIAFLASFLDDATERTFPLFPDNETVARQLHAGRTVESKFDGPCAACNFKTIEVRDFAAMQLAGFLNINERPEESWTADDWRTFREQVLERLAATK